LSRGVVALEYIQLGAIHRSPLDESSMSRLVVFKGQPHMFCCGLRLCVPSYKYNIGLCRYMLPEEDCHQRINSTKTIEMSGDERIVNRYVYLSFSSRCKPTSF